MEPILKWAGGKRLLVGRISDYINSDEIRKLNGHYFEPFIGGGAVCFSLELPNSIINDCNSELINVYDQVKNNVDELINLLQTHKLNYSADYYEKIKAMDRDLNYNDLPAVVRAARFIFLNKTCYNGLYRVNSQGYFNVPNGKYKNPDIVSERKIRQLSSYFNKSNITFRNMDFELAVQDAGINDVVYFDPPYDYEKGGFTSYSSDGFTRDDLKRLKQTCDRLIDKGCKVIISNNDTEFVNELFGDNRYIIDHIEANRFISCDGTRRKKVKEVIIYGH